MSTKAKALKGAFVLIGSVIGWLVAHHQDIADILVRKPRVQITTDDEYVLRNGQFTITARGDSTVIVSDSVPSPPKWFRIPAGAFTISVSALGDELFRRDFTVESGERRVLVIPELSTGNIRVTARNLSTRIGPGASLEFRVESSGNGFLWVIERRANAFELIYPGDCIMECGNEISVTKGYHLPDAKGRTIIAGRQAGEERLLFVVTSRPDVEYARGVARQFTNAVTTKAEAGRVKDNWGYAELAYQVLSP